MAPVALALPLIATQEPEKAAEQTGTKPNKVLDLSQSALAGNLAQRSNGNPVCGLGKEFHKGRRDALRAQLEPGVVVLRGLPGPRGNSGFHQDKNFWYLTGVESPRVAFLMDVETGKEVLFVNEPNERGEIWNGEIWDTDDQWIRDLTGVDDLRIHFDLDEAIEELLDPGEVIYTIQTSHIGLSGSYDSAEPYDRQREKDPFDGRINREKALKAKLEAQFEVEVKDLTQILREIRWVKQPEEIDALRRASLAGALAIEEGIRSTKPNMGEWDLAAVMSWVQQRNGATGPAYAAIVGSGANALILHYNFSVRRMLDGELVLVDFGPEVDKYVTDITRTWPVNGTFDERQIELYDAVLRAQAAGIAAAKPGNSVNDVEKACRAVLVEAGLANLQRHGACHWVGMEVHDPGPRRSRSRELVPGVVFTIEPGLYEMETSNGIRIEDVVVITEDGCEVITKDVPKDRASLERLVREEGVLDWLEERSKR